MANVILEEDTHTYVNLDKPDFKYISTTTMLGLYEPEFDAPFHAARVAKREGVTPEEILARWKEINRIAIEYGTKVHKIMERHFLNKQKLYIPRDDFERTVLTEFMELKMLQDHHIIRPEYIVTHELTETHGIAGSIDILEDENENSFNIFDFKTNRELTFGTKYGHWMKFPVHHLSQSKYNMDCLQLSVYAYFYEMESGKKVNTMGIVYWDRGDELVSETGVWKVVYIPFLKTDIKNIINHYKTTKLIAA